MIKQGDKGQAVKDLQANLAKLGYVITVDGDFGAGTNAVVKKFQGQNNLTQDGIVGDNTLNAINAKLQIKPVSTTTTEVKSDMDFFKDNIYKHTLVWEGGGKLHNVVSDSGGWTVYGISYNNNRQHFNSLEDFKKMSYEKACELAYNEYYLPIKANLVPNEAKLMYFDIGFNAGNSRAIKLMQRCIGVADDGKIGPITESKMNGVTSQCLYEKRKAFYNSLVANKPSLGKFMKGWMNRTEAIYKIKNK